MKLLKATTVFLIFVVSTAWGRFTTINDASYRNEPDLFQILDVVAPFSDSWGSTSALNSNASGLRIDDDFDQFWKGGTIKVTVLASFWGVTAVPGDTAGQFFQYADVDGFNPTPVFNLDSPGDAGSLHIGSEQFVIGNGGMGGAWSSQALNNDFLDRTVTFNVTGLDVYAWTAGDVNNPIALLKSSGQLESYIAAFEIGRDGDFQDMLFLIQSVKPIPAPGAIVLSCFGLFTAGWMKYSQFLS